jgi:hypothetical protein
MLVAIAAILLPVRPRESGDPVLPNRRTTFGQNWIPAFAGMNGCWYSSIQSETALTCLGAKLPDLSSPIRNVTTE